MKKLPIMYAEAAVMLDGPYGELANIAVRIPRERTDITEAISRAMTAILEAQSACLTVKE